MSSGAFSKEKDEQRLIKKAQEMVKNTQTTKESVTGLALLDSPEFADVRLTSLTANTTLGNVAKSLKSYLLRLWAKLSDHAALETDAHGGIVAATDVRLTDERTPTVHAASHSSTGADPLFPADIGAAESSHSHEVADIDGFATVLASKQDSLGPYTAGAPAATGYVDIVVGGVMYKVLVAV